jgi:hypothetical protein
MQREAHRNVSSSDSLPEALQVTSRIHLVLFGMQNRTFGLFRRPSSAPDKQRNPSTLGGILHH